MEEFLPPNSSEDQTTAATSSSAQMQTRIKLLGGCSQIIGGIHPPRVSAPLVITQKNDLDISLYTWLSMHFDTTQLCHVAYLTVPNTVNCFLINMQ